MILPAHSTSNDFVDEEKERQAKNEEVLKTIERAKRRREEEEQKYGKAEGRQQYGGGRGGGDVYDNSGYEGGRYPDAPPPRRQHSGSDRNNRKSPGLGGSRGGPSGDYRQQQQHSAGPDRGSFGKFDVGGKEEDGPSAASPPSSASNEAGTGRAQGRALGPDPGTRGGPPKYSVYDDRHKGWADSQTFPAGMVANAFSQYFLLYLDCNIYLVAIHGSDRNGRVSGRKPKNNWPPRRGVIWMVHNPVKLGGLVFFWQPLHSTLDIRVTGIWLN